MSKNRTTPQQNRTHGAALPSVAEARAQLEELRRRAAEKRAADEAKAAVAAPVEPAVAAPVEPVKPIIPCRSITPILISPAAPHADPAPGVTEDPVLAAAVAGAEEWLRTAAGRKLTEVTTIVPGRLWTVIEARVKGAFIAGYRAGAVEKG